MRRAMVTGTVLSVFLAAMVTAVETDPIEKPICKRPTVIEAGSAELACVADTSIAAYPIGLRSLTAKWSEQGTNAGKAPRIKIKKFENQPILRFDFSAVPCCATITAAELVVRIPDGKPLNHVGVSSLHVDWAEGEGAWGDEGEAKLEHKGACFLGPKGIESRWQPYESGDFNKASAGNGGNATCVVRARHVEGDRWVIPIDPYVVQAAAEHGQSLILTDESGIFGGALSNAFIFSREVAGKAPVLKVSWEAGADGVAPAFAGAVKAEPAEMAGALILHLPAAGDDSTKGQALGYRVSVNGQEVRRAAIPRPARRIRTMVLRDLPAGKTVDVTVTAYDEARNTAAQSVRVKAGGPFTGKLAGPMAPAQKALPAGRSCDAFSATIVDGETLYDPITGKMSAKQVRAGAVDGVAAKTDILAVRGEFVGVQCLITLAEGVDRLEEITVEASDLVGAAGTIPAANLEFFREHYVKMGDVWVADILPAIGSGETVAIPSQPEIKGQRSLGIYIDLLVGKATVAGRYVGQISVNSAAGKATCPIAVTVRDVTLPDELRFVVEMNAYGHSRDVKVFHETFRLCHKHRLSYNVLGYGHSNTTGNFTAPVLNSDRDAAMSGKDVKVIDWSAYDKYLGPLFSGKVAEDLPRKGVPATHWYLPLHDAWPSLLSKCNPKFWAGRVAPRQDKDTFDAWVNGFAAMDPLVEDHFCDAWQGAGRSVSAQFREHFESKGWTRTNLQIFDNHKYYFASGSQSLWTMDEPQYGRDYRALNWIYSFFDEAIGDGQMATEIRADVSRPALMGDRMDDSLDLMVVSSAVDRHPRLLEDLLMSTNAHLWWYGGGGGTDADPAMYMALFTYRWGKGCDGGIPVYTSFGGDNGWGTTGRLRVVRFDEKTSTPVASIRMKAYRRAQQDMELLNILSAKKGFSRWHVRDLVTKEFPTKIVTVSKGPDDPGYSTFEDLDVGRYDLLRERVVATILKD